MKKLIAFSVLCLTAACAPLPTQDNCETSEECYAAYQREVKRDDLIDTYWMCRQYFTENRRAWIVINRDLDSIPDIFDMRRELGVNGCSR